MSHYSLDPENATKSCKSRRSNVGVHLKGSCETAQATKGVHICKATRYLRCHFTEQCVPFRHYDGGVGRCAQAKWWGCTQGPWPKKSAEIWLHVLKNAESNAELEGLDVNSLEHIQVNKAHKMQCRPTELMYGNEKLKANKKQENKYRVQRWLGVWGLAEHLQGHDII